MASHRYIVREGTVRGQGRYWSFEAGAGRGGYFWDHGDPVIYDTWESAWASACLVGGRVVRLTSRAERARRRLLAIEEQAKRVARAERWREWAERACLVCWDPGMGQALDEAYGEALDALAAERRKLAEMVGGGS